MKRTWYILVADSGTAKIFRAQGVLKDLELVHEQSNPAGRKTRSELESDRPGQQRNDQGGAHGLGGDTNAHRHESDQFARELCGQLHRDHEAKKFTDLLIAAPPHFLGDLRHHLSGDCQKVLGKEIHKDIVRVDASEILAHFA